MGVSQRWRPLEIDPGAAGVEPTVTGLCDFLARTSDLDDILVREKALVFRGFGVTDSTIEDVMNHLLPNRLAYVHGNSPRTKVGRNIYTSTEYPPEYTISMHNELSYAHSWPARLMFCCALAEMTGGATPVVDGVRWLESLDDRVRADFAAGVMYRQNLHGGYGLGKSWQETFETKDHAEVERFLSGTEASWTWTADDGLRISQTRAATTRHPVTGVEVWFSQADQWHTATLGDETVKTMAAVLDETDLPQSVTFADGSPIPADYVLQIRDRGLDNAVDVDWRQGDVLLIDNVLVGHGRRPFNGRRRVLVAMSD
jgi:alpha-ketoglutarate-dependent taurine dioxygenase